jgi:predicted small secreted protein
MRMRAAVLLLIVATLALSACNTIHGMGRDMQDLGNAIQRSTR